MPNANHRVTNDPVPVNPWNRHHNAATQNSQPVKAAGPAKAAQAKFDIREQTRATLAQQHQPKQQHPHHAPPPAPAATHATRVHVNEAHVNKCVRAIETLLQKLACEGHRELPFTYFYTLVQRTYVDFSSAVVDAAFSITTGPEEGFARKFKNANGAETIAFIDVDARLGIVKPAVAAPQQPPPKQTTTASITAPAPSKPTAQTHATVHATAPPVTAAVAPSAPPLVDDSQYHPAALDLRQLLISFADDGDAAPRMSVLGALLKSQGYTQPQRAEAFRVAVSTEGGLGFAIQVGTLGNASLVLRPGIRKPAVPTTEPEPLAKRPASGVAAMSTQNGGSTQFLRDTLHKFALDGELAPRMSLVGTMLAAAGYSAKERADAFSQALSGPDAFAMKEGSAGNTTLSLLDAARYRGLPKVHQDASAAAAIHVSHDPIGRPVATTTEPRIPKIDYTQVLRAMLEKHWRAGEKSVLMTQIGAALEKEGLVGDELMAVLQYATSPKGFADFGGERGHPVLTLREAPPSAPRVAQPPPPPPPPPYSSTVQPPPPPPPPIAGAPLRNEMLPQPQSHASASPASVKFMCPAPLL